ncbi:hypothetical protein, partial [uncultured Ruegeria sp.]|uniref:hypothetical protein n=1 Tax=uncultured Ruegeria sp. TaxID=259304 RepID=UPI00261D2B07
MLNQTGTHLYNSAIGSWDDNSSFPIGLEFELAVPLVMCIAVTEARALLHKWWFERTSPFPGRIYPTGSVT